MYNDDKYRIIPTAIHSGGSIGMHRQDSGDDLNYIISGVGKAICDGAEEGLKPGVMHICPQGSEHSIINTGDEDLVMLTIVVKK
ncbi:MAG: cupin domain-containing protein [Erysipelotrichaceae bacterium]|nr:cupin domain-containing protein [Erysipelotrichaceae bacterium]